MRIQFLHNAIDEPIATFEVREVPTQEQCEAIQNEISQAVEKWGNAHDDDYADFDFWQVCHDVTVKNIRLARNPVVQTFYV